MKKTGLFITGLSAVALAGATFAGSLAAPEVEPMVEVPAEAAGSSDGSSVNPLWIIIPLAIGAVLLADDDDPCNEEIC